MQFIPFNKPYLTGKEVHYIYDAVQTKKISGNGKYTQLCQIFFEEKYSIKKALLTTSCTDALEMAAILLNIQPGDEVLIPSYTFVSTANAFILRGAKVIFVDSQKNSPNIDYNLLEPLITKNTKAIIAVHYAGIACDMDKIVKIAQKHNLYVIEDAAQSINSFYKNIPLGSIGHLAAFSFHETKNIISGEGGLLAINDTKFSERAEIIWEKGTNRTKFFRGEVDKYGWVDIGSSFLPSELTAAFLYAQLENLEIIQNKRKKIWKQYFNGLKHLEKNNNIELPFLPDFATNNAHLFYIVCKNSKIRDELIKYLRENNIYAVFHYLGLHASEFYAQKHGSRVLPFCDKYVDCLVRLPLYFELSESEIDYIVEKIDYFFSK